MKKIFWAIILSLVPCSLFLTACGTNKPAGDKVKVVATIFPAYDWAREIIGSNDAFDLTLLADKGIDLHSFQPSAQDIMTISNCDVFIYVGGESDEWVNDALKQAVNKNIVVVNLMNALGDKVLQENHDGHIEGDEHVWLSLTNAQILCDAITDALIKAAPAQVDTLKANDAAYLGRDGLLYAGHGV